MRRVSETLWKLMFAPSDHKIWWALTLLEREVYSVDYHHAKHDKSQGYLLVVLCRQVSTFLDKGVLNEALRDFERYYASDHTVLRQLRQLRTEVIPFGRGSRINQSPDGAYVMPGHIRIIDHVGRDSGLTVMQLMTNGFSPEDKAILENMAEYHVRQVDGILLTIRNLREAIAR